MTPPLLVRVTPTEYVFQVNGREVVVSKGSGIEAARRVAADAAKHREEK